MKPIQVGLLGIGTVGSGTFKVLQRNQEEIQRRAGRGIRIATVADVDRMAGLTLDDLHCDFQVPEQLKLPYGERWPEADVALLADNRSYHWPNAFELLKPKIVVIHHYDQWRTPLSEGIPESNRRRAQRFARVITSFDSRIKVIIPELLKTMTLE